MILSTDAPFFGRGLSILGAVVVAALAHGVLLAAEVAPKDRGKAQAPGGGDADDAGPAFDVVICDPHGSPLTGGGWTLPASRAEAKLPEAEPDMAISAQGLERPPIVDGRLRESGWRSPVMVPGLRYYDSGGIEPVGARTTVRFLQDNHSLYIGVTCADTRLPSHLEAPDELKEMLKGHEIIVVLDPEADPDNGLSMRYFRVSAVAPRASASSGKLPEVGEPWDYAVAYGKGSWTVEMRIDWWGLAPTPNFRETWLVDVVRIRGGRDGRRPWTPFDNQERRADPTAFATAATSDPFERNSAWGRSGALWGEGRKQMPRLRLKRDFSPFLWSVRGLSVTARQGKEFHDCRMTVGNRTGTDCDVVLAAVSKTKGWRQSVTTQELSANDNQNVPVELGYGVEQPGEHSLQIAVVDKKTGLILRKSPAYQIRPTGSKNAIAVRMAQNEREHASFVLTPERDLSGVSVKISDLFCEGVGVIFAKNVAIRSLESALGPKAWRVDSDGTRAYVPEGERQADVLQPLGPPSDIAKERARHIWLTFDSHALAPGVYTGRVTIEAVKVPPVEIPVSIEVTEASVAAANRPFFGVWASWPDAKIPAGAVPTMARLGVGSLRYALTLDASDRLEWTETGQALAREAGRSATELALSLPGRAFDNDILRSRMGEILTAARDSATSAKLSFMMSGLPYGEGLRSAYAYLTETFKGARTACLVDPTNPRLKDSAGLLSDWYIESGAGDELGASGALNHFDDDPQWRDFIASHRPDNRFIIVYTAPNRPTVDDTAGDMRNVFWYAWQGGYDGVAARPVGASVVDTASPSAGLTPVTMWVEPLAPGYPPRLSRQFESLVDGAEDYALLEWFRGRIESMKAAKLKRSERKRLKRMEAALKAVLEATGPAAGEVAFSQRRKAIFDSLLDEDEIKRRYRKK